MIVTVGALSCLGLRSPVASDTNSCMYFDSKHDARVCLGTIQARSTEYDLPCNTCTDTLGTRKMNVLIMPLQCSEGDSCSFPSRYQ